MRPEVTARCRDQLEGDEGFRAHVYVCPAGALTIGYGRNVDPDRGGPGISQNEARVMLGNDIAECAADLANLFTKWDTFTLARQAALINLRFQLGPFRLRGFKKMIAAISAGDWATAAKELQDSQLAKQTPARTTRRAMELRNG